MSKISGIGKYLVYTLCSPNFGEFRFLRRDRKSDSAFVNDRSFSTTLGKYSRYLRRTESLHTKWKNFLNDFCRFFVHKPLLFVVVVFLVTVWWYRTKMFPRHTFGFEYGAYLLARVFCVPLVNDIAKRSEVVIRAAFAVYPVVDSNKPHVRFGESNLRIESDFQIISAEPRHIFHNNRSDFSFVHVVHKSLEVGAVKVRSRIPVVHIEARIGKAVFLRILA